MKSINQTSMDGRIGRAIEVLQPTLRKLVVRKLVIACLSLAMATAPVTGVLADGVFMMQYEFALGKKPGFRQLNLVYQDNFGETESFDPGYVEKSSVAIPLYSMNPRTPGIFNRLEDDQSGEEDESKVDIRAVVSGLVVLGVIALYTYAAVKCVEDIDNYEQNSAACEAL